MFQIPAVKTRGTIAPEKYVPPFWSAVTQGDAREISATNFDVLNGGRLLT
jgi:hypothetical protein